MSEEEKNLLYDIKTIENMIDEVALAACSYDAYCYEIKVDQLDAIKNILAYTKNKSLLRTCAYCGKDFKAKQNSRKYCCTTCRNKSSIKHSNKKIHQFDKKGNFIQTFESLTEASKQTKTHINSISMVLTGRRKSVNGYIYKYVKE